MKKAAAKTRANKGRKMKVDKRRKMKVDKRMKMQQKILMGEEEAMHQKILMGVEEANSKEEEMRSMSPSVKKYSDKLSDSSEESESEEEDNIRRSPVEVKGFSYYFDTKVYGGLRKDESESDEDVLGDDDRYEVDHGFIFKVKKWWMTVTNPKVPQKIYFKSDGSQSFSTFPSLRHPDFPVAAISKIALETYNSIQNKKYEYVGLVKAYHQSVNGFHFWTRFKARLPGQDDINFQAITFQGCPHRKTNVVPLRFQSFYPLPPS